MTATKVPAFPIPPNPWRTLPEPLQATRVLPFATTARATRMHRVRSVSIYPETEHFRAHLSVHTWCGQALAGAVMTADPGDWEVCGTCEGRAIGAGQIPAPLGYESDLIFTPRTAVARCEWTVHSYLRYGVSTSPCGARGRAVATCGDRRLTVCNQHIGSALSKGWTLTEATR